MLPATIPKPPRLFFLSTPPSTSLSSLHFSDLSLRQPCPPAILALHRSPFTSKLKCFANSTTEDQLSDSETNSFVDSTADDQLSDSEARESGEIDFEVVGAQNGAKVATDSESSIPKTTNSASSDLLSLGIPEPVYQVVEVKSDGMISTKQINRRHLLKSSGLRPRDIRSVDPSLWLTNTMPSLLVREHAILLNLGSLRAIVMQERVLIFNYNRRGGKAFIDSLLPRLSPENSTGGLSMPFVLERLAPEKLQYKVELIWSCPKATVGWL